MRLYNPRTGKSFRRELRAALTPAEAALWKHLQRKQLAGKKFRRQHGIGPYVVDFYCPEERLAIELDGASHDHASAHTHDSVRDRFLLRAGLRVLHFENREVIGNLEGVLLEIKKCFSFSSGAR